MLNTQYAMDCWEKEIRPATCAKYIDHIYKVAPVVIAVDGRATAIIKKIKKRDICFIPLNTIINTIMIVLQRTILKQQLFNPS
jgi:hypothetical protein